MIFEDAKYECLSCRLFDLFDTSLKDDPELGVIVGFAGIKLPWVRISRRDTGVFIPETLQNGFIFGININFLFLNRLTDLIDDFVTHYSA